MREFVVSLRSGKRYVIRAERVAFLDPDTLALVVEPAPIIGAPVDSAVAVFDRRLVASVVAADHLVSEADEPEVVTDPDADIPF